MKSRGEQGRLSFVKGGTPSLLLRWLEKRFDRGEDGHSTDEEEWQREEHEQGVEPWDFSGNYGFVGICGIDETGRLIAWLQFVDGFPHGSDADVAAHVGAEKVIAVAGMAGTVDVVFIMDIDAIGRTAFRGTASIQLA